MQEILVEQGAVEPGEIEQHLDAAVRSSLLLESVYLVGGDGRVGSDQAGFRGHHGARTTSGSTFAAAVLPTGGRNRAARVVRDIPLDHEREHVPRGLRGLGKALVGSFNIERLQEFTHGIQGKRGVTVSVIDRRRFDHRAPGRAGHAAPGKVHQIELVRRGDRRGGSERSRRVVRAGRDRQRRRASRAPAGLSSSRGRLPRPIARYRMAALGFGAGALRSRTRARCSSR